jgi:N-acetylglutamate synthase
MVPWPALGTRVTVRYRRPAGSVPPLTDAVGHLLALDPMVRVLTKSGAVAEFAAGDVVALRVLSDAPVRTSEIRALEHAAAAARPGVEQTWLDGWLLRAGRGATLAANSAVPLEISASADTIPSIIAWYTRRDLPARLAIPDRLLQLPAGLLHDGSEQVLVRDVPAPDGPPELDIFGAHPDPAVPRAAVTDAPDGTRWVGLPALPTTDQTSARRSYEALLAWGARAGATRGYLRVDEHDAGTAALAQSLGFRLHHRSRYFTARSGGWDTV